MRTDVGCSSGTGTCPSCKTPVGTSTHVSPLYNTHIMSVKIIANSTHLHPLARQIQWPAWSYSCSLGGNCSTKAGSPHVVLIPLSSGFYVSVYHISVQHRARQEYSENWDWGRRCGMMKLQRFTVEPALAVGGKHLQLLRSRSDCARHTDSQHVTDGQQKAGSFFAVNVVSFQD